jgi:hypothetical protein
MNIKPLMWGRHIRINLTPTQFKLMKDNEGKEFCCYSSRLKRRKSEV